MAQATQKIEIAELVRRSEASRLRLSDAHSALQDKLNVHARIKESLKAEPANWLGGSLIAGLVVSRLFRSKRKPVQKIGKIKKQRSLLLGTFKLVSTLAKPAAKIYATKLLKDYFAKQLDNGIARRPPQGNIPRY